MAMDGQSPLSDIQTYLATFNPKEQAQIILQQPDGTFIKGEDQGQIDDASSLEDQGISDQPLLTPAAPSIGDDQQLVQGQHIITPDQSSILVSQAGQETGSDAAVQVLANVAATSIPQLPGQQQMVAMQSQDGTQQMVSVARGQPSTSLSGVQVPATQQETQSDGQNMVLGQTATNPFQTVTIVPSEVNQGGEVSYVLIVSQPDKEGVPQGDGDMSVYDFKEEGSKTFAEGEAVGPADANASKKIIKVTPKRTPQGMQAQLMCNYCNYTSPKRYLLTRHMKTHSEERPHKCNICDRGFKTVASLQNHINTHTGVRPQKCKECDAAFTTSGELVRHVRYRHTFEKPHKCTECDYASVELSKLKRHMRSHTGERPYQCPHCSYASPDTFKLKRHLRIHTGEKPYECDVCHMRFTQSNSLKAHKLIHTGNKPVFQCELCPTTCGRKTDLKIHVQKLHTSDKPLQCKKCGKSFPDRYTYKIHLKTHEGEKCFKCELCPYAALSQRHLESHILTHTGEKPFQCDECDQSFRQKQLLRRHKNLYHTPDYVPPAPKEKSHECGDCNKVFAHRGNLLRHMALHDPENPGNKELLAEAEEADQTEGYEEEEIGLEAPGQIIQTVMTDQGMQQIVVQQPGQLRTAQGQQIQLQLVTEDGESAGQIFLQMQPEDGTSGQQIEVQQPQHIIQHVQQVDPDMQQQQLMQQQVGEPEEEEDQEDLEEEEEEEMVEEPPQPVAVITPGKRGRGRPPRNPQTEIIHIVKQEDDDEEDEEEEVPVTPRRGRGRPRKQQHVDDEDEVEDDEDGEEEDEPVPTRSSKRKGGTPDVATPTKRGRGSPKKKIKEEDEQQKKKDIEECFGFNMDD